MGRRGLGSGGEQPIEGKIAKALTGARSQAHLAIRCADAENPFGEHGEDARPGHRGERDLRQPWRSGHIGREQRRAGRHDGMAQGIEASEHDQPCCRQRDLTGGLEAQRQRACRRPWEQGNGLWHREGARVVGGDTMGVMGALGVLVALGSLGSTGENWEPPGRSDCMATVVRSASRFGFCKFGHVSVAGESAVVGDLGTRFRLSLATRRAERMLLRAVYSRGDKVVDLGIWLR